jgi:hypothetical protein
MGRKAGIRMLRSLTLIACSAAALWMAAPASADEPESPLAVTGAASPSQRATPTVAELVRSEKYLQAGLDALKAGAPQRAVQDLLDSVRLAPGADNYKALATAYYQAGNAPKAGWACRQSLKRRPDAKLQALADQLQGAAPGAEKAPEARSAEAAPRAVAVAGAPAALSEDARAAATEALKAAAKEALKADAADNLRGAANDAASGRPRGASPVTRDNR